MAKEGIEFFPLQCQLDEKWELLEAEYGLKGFAVVIKILQRIYREHGYYCEWSDDIALLFARQQGIVCTEEKGNFVTCVVAAAVRRGIFDRQLYETCGILTSCGIQKRYLEIVRKRKAVRMEKAYLLLSAREIGENVVILGENGGRNGKNGGRNQQSKVKESNKNTNVFFVANSVPESATPPAPPAEKTEKPVFSEESFEMRCVDKLSGALLKQLPGARVPRTLAERQKWAIEIDRMKRLDKRSEEEIWKALEFAVTDPFWKTNIRSTRKLREKFETLLLQSSRPAGRQKDRTPNRFHNLQEHGYDYEKMVLDMMGGGQSGGRS